MTDPSLLLSIFTIFILVSTYHITKTRGLLYGGIYFFIYIYCIFAQIGYAYFPSLSILVNAYYGIDAFYEAYNFVFLSFLLLYALIVITNKSHYSIGIISVIKFPSKIGRIIAIVIIAACQLWVSAYFFTNYDSINYTTMSSGEHIWFTGIFKNVIYIDIILYVLYRQINAGNRHKKSFIIALLLYAGILLTILISLKTGNRTDLIALFLGICIYELSVSTGRELYNKFKYLIVLAFIVIIMSAVSEGNRSEYKVDSQFSGLEKIIYKDYFAPFHILYASIGNKFVFPDKVILSNINNSLILMDYPYLQHFIQEIIAPAITSRNEGYAFFIFSEGYIFMGMFGFIYNGVVVFLGMSLWKSLCTTKNKHFNIVMLCVLSTQFANIARGQSSYFIKRLYTLILPSVFIYCLLIGIIPYICIRIFKKETGKGNI